MRLSEILKSDHLTVSRPVVPEKPEIKPKPAQKTPQPPAKPPVSKSNVSAIPTSSDVAAAIDHAISESRKDLEKGFKQELEKIKADARRTTEEQLREEEKRSFARTEALKKEKLQLEKEKQDLAKQLGELRQGLETTQASNQQLENAKKEILDSRNKLADEYQRKIMDLELERQRKKETPPAAQMPVPAPPPPSVPKPSIAAAAPQSTPPPKFTPTPLVEKTITSVPALNPALTIKARDLYQGLLVGTQTFFELAKRNEIQPSILSKLLDRFVEEADLHDDLIAVIAEPYGASQAFISHAVNCGILAIILGNDMKLSFEELRELGFSAIAHDLGLLGVQEELNYPRLVTEHMRSEILNHAEKSATLLTGHISETVLVAIRQHHELANGKGYPKGIQGDEIHLFAKILSVVDAFEAMTHERPYRTKPMEIYQAVKEMIEVERGLYDRDVMKVLLARVGLYPVKSLVELSNRQVARILRQNRQFPLSPIVQIEFDENGLRMQVPLTIDLSKNQLIHITGAVRSTPSYAKEQIEMKKVAKKPSRINSFTALKEIAPIFIMAAVLLLLVYLIIKI